MCTQQCWIIIFDKRESTTATKTHTHFFMMNLVCYFAHLLCVSGWSSIPIVFPFASTSHPNKLESMQHHFELSSVLYYINNTRMPSARSASHSMLISQKKFLIWVFEQMEQKEYIPFYEHYMHSLCTAQLFGFIFGKCRSNIGKILQKYLIYFAVLRLSSNYDNLVHQSKWDE